MSFVGNKGEWSELYAFVKLLSTGKLYAADEHVNKINDSYFPIFKILRTNETENDTDYVINSNDGSVSIYVHGNVIKTIKQKELKDIASYLYKCITEGENRTFAIEKSEQLMKRLHLKKIVAPSTDKTDIALQIREIYTSINPIRGFSIKSELGYAPTLLNASSATNFIFKVKGISDEIAKGINSIDTRSKIKDRLLKICQLGSLKFKGAKNLNFYANLMMIDSNMNDIVADILKDYYLSSISDCKTLIERIEKRNPLKYPRCGMYEYKFKKLLCSIALGMMPSKVWNGYDEANGGYIIVKKDGDIVAYHIYNRDKFETYLLNSTKLDHGSSSRHGFASIYVDDDKDMCIDLNMQIRFI